jgi:hypothetical protein
LESSSGRVPGVMGRMMRERARERERER